MKLPPIKDIIAVAGLIVDGVRWGWALFGPEPKPRGKAPGELSHRDAEIQAEAARRAGPPGRVRGR